MVCSGSCIIPLRFSCGSGSNVYSWNFQLAPVSVLLLGADFLKHFNLLVDIKGRRVVHADFPESVIFRASPGPQPAFKSIAFLSAPEHVKKLLADFPDILSSSNLTASKPCHRVRHHLLTNPGPLVFTKPWRLDLEKLAAAKEEFSTKEKAGIIRRSTSPWSCPLLMLKKGLSSSYGEEKGWRLEAMWSLQETEQRHSS